MGKAVGEAVGEVGEGARGIGRGRGRGEGEGIGWSRSGAMPGSRSGASP